MADEAIRSAARSWRTSGDPSDLARLVLAGARAGTLPAGAADLAERIAAGTVAFDDVELAALLGDPLARAIAGEALAERCAYQGRDRAFDVGVAPGPIGWEALDDWLQVAASFGRRALARVLHAAIGPIREACRSAAAMFDESDDYAGFYVEMHERDRRFALDDLDVVERVIEGALAGEVDLDLRTLLASADRYRTVTFRDDALGVAKLAGDIVLSPADPALPLHGWAELISRTLPASTLRAAVCTTLAPRLLRGV